MSNFSGAPFTLKEGATESHIQNARSATAEWTFGQRARSKPVTGAALGAWRGAWGRAAAPVDPAVSRVRVRDRGESRSPAGVEAALPAIRRERQTAAPKRYVVTAWAEMKDPQCERTFPPPHRMSPVERAVTDWDRLQPDAVS